MGTRIQDAKLARRSQVREKLAALPESNRAVRSTQACSLIRGQNQWEQAHSVLFYAPVAKELDVWPLLTAALASGKTVALPRFVPETSEYIACAICDPTKDLVPGSFGIREPADHCAPLSPNRLDFILVPGVAFDLQGRRLGRGNGFYDRLLTTLRGTTCGVAFDEQIIREVPVEPHDVPVNCILTPTRWIEL